MTAPRLVSVRDFDPGRQIHTCTICGCRGNWSHSWSWYGSIGDWDKGKPIIKACSDECARKVKAPRE